MEANQTVKHSKPVQEEPPVVETKTLQDQLEEMRLKYKPRWDPDDFEEEDSK